MSESQQTSSSPGAVALALGFGTAVVLWTCGFLARLPGVTVPSALLLFVFVAVLIGGGARARGWRAGAATGAIASVVNLLILGSLLTDGSRPLPTAALWVPGSILAGAALGAVGGALTARREVAARDANAILARVAVGATLALVAVGGLVTSYEAGLAVVDWPNSYGSNMFLFPLSRMVGGIYYEHAHRLFGSLVGLTTLVLAIRLLVTEPRRGVKLAGVLGLLLVIGQGILGGLRVTGHFTLSDSPEVVRPNVVLALVHGITGQIFLAWMTGLAVVTSRTWKHGPLRAAIDGHRTLPVVLVACLVLQLVLGVHLRHLGSGLLLHISFAAIVLMVAVATAVRTMGSFSELAPLRKGSAALLGHVMTQLVLGGLAYVAVARDPSAPPDTFEVLMATGHQTVGALLFANAALLAVWHRRIRAAA